MKQREKLKMWYQVESLRNKNLNKSQIARELGIHRGTVRKYCLMSESEFLTHIEQVNRMPKKLKEYYGYVVDILKDQPYLSAAVVEDRLKEKYTDLPKVHSKTVYNFVQSIRLEKNIPKPKTIDTRQYEQIAQTSYGQEAQVDFGEQWMLTQGGQRLKVYFMAIVLSRSRYKYISFTDRPFTSALSVKAHQLAFEYFEGVPQKVLYDQDKVFITDEYGGDVVLTSTFRRYTESESFHVEFCRKADPQTKGKVENVVKYVKQNFLRGRTYHSLSRLNEEAIKWLERTANSKKHGATHKIPKTEWLIEKRHLLPVKNTNSEFKSESTRRSYKVRKDNTVVYRSNFYSVPTGTYIDKSSSVYLEIKEDHLCIYDKKDDSLIARHLICVLKGQLIRNNDHLRDKQSSLKEKEKKVLDRLHNDLICTQFLHSLHTDKPRYYHDHLREMIKILDYVEVKLVKAAAQKCLTMKIFNAFDLHKIIRQMEDKRVKTVNISTQKMFLPHEANIQPLKSDINTYQFIMK